ncbi:MAG: DUF1559 domain-containing protein [Planctomycetota bacterium]
MRSLVQAGTRELAISIAAEDLLQGMPMISASTDNAPVVVGLLSMIWNGTGLKHIPVHSIVENKKLRFGSRTTLDRQQLPEAQATKRFDRIFQDHPLDHHLMISLPPDARRDIAAIWPDQAPRGAPIEFSPKQITRDLASLQLHWSLPPEPGFSARFETVDADAAQRIAELILDWSGQHEGLQTNLDVQTNDNEVDVAMNARFISDFISQAVNQMFRSQEKTRRVNDLKQIGLALHNHHAAFRAFPTDIGNDDGKALLSWRVAVLPFMEQAKLHEVIDKSVPWNQQGDANLDDIIVPTYSTKDHQTTIRIPVIRGSLWNTDTPPADFSKIIDGTSNTIAMIDAPASAAVPWMKPGYLRLDEDDLLNGVFGNREETHVLFFDGSVHRLKRSEMTNEKLRAMLTFAGRELIDP